MIKLKLYFFLLTFLLSNLASSEEYIYKVNWGFIPLAEIKIYVNTINYPILAKFKVKSLSTIRLLRPYDTEGYLKKINDNSHIYAMDGMDNNKIEKRLIEYSLDSVPIIYKFIDDKGEPHLVAHPTRDIGAIDPFSVLINIMKKIRSEGSCDSQYAVYDGKRRYKVNVELVGYEYLDSDRKWSYSRESIHCRVSLIKAENEIIMNINNSAEWPLEFKNMRIIDVWFALKGDYQPVKFNMKATIGKTKGRLMVRNKGR